MLIQTGKFSNKRVLFLSILSVLTETSVKKTTSFLLFIVNIFQRFICTHLYTWVLCPWLFGAVWKPTVYTGIWAIFLEGIFIWRGGRRRNRSNCRLKQENTFKNTDGGWRIDSKTQVLHKWYKHKATQNKYVSINNLKTQMSHSTTNTHKKRKAQIQTYRTTHPTRVGTEATNQNQQNRKRDVNKEASLTGNILLTGSKKTTIHIYMSFQ